MEASGGPPRAACGLYAERLKADGAGGRVAATGTRAARCRDGDREISGRVHQRCTRAYGASRPDAAEQRQACSLWPPELSMRQALKARRQQRPSARALQAAAVGRKRAQRTQAVQSRESAAGLALGRYGLRARRAPRRELGGGRGGQEARVGRVGRSRSPCRRSAWRTRHSDHGPSTDRPARGSNAQARSLSSE